MPPYVLSGMGLVITPLHTPRRFNPLAQPLEASQKLGGRELVWNFNGGDITSDGGALVLKKLEERTRIVRRFAACFTDYRNPKLIEHPLLDLIAQRVFGLALGYEDLNDHDELRRDPMLAVALSKDDVKGQQRRRAQDRGKALAGKSTLKRLELTAPDYDGSPRQKESDKPETKKIVVDPESIDALLVDLFLEAHAQAPERIILDLDATDDILYGQQEGRFYHGYYHDYCYLPLYVFCGEHLLCARLRMSNIDASADSVEELEPVVARIRQRWPAVEILLRGDGGFCREKLMAWCEREGIKYIFGLAQNARLKKLIEEQMAQAEKQYEQTKAPARVFSEFFYATQDTWSRQRRVIAKAEHIAKGANPRFVVTSLSPQRGHYEARIGAFGDVLGLGDHPPLAAPGVLGRIEEFTEHPGGRFGLLVLLLRLRHLLFDQFLQPRILRQPEDIVHTLALAPRHQLLAAETAVAPQQNLHRRPALANARHHRLQLLHRIGRSVDIGHPQARAQQMLPAKHVQRQIAVIVVIAVIKAPFLLPVQDIVGGIQIQNDPLGSLCMRF